MNRQAAREQYRAELYRLETGHRHRSVTEIVVITTIWSVIGLVSLAVLGGAFLLGFVIVRHFWGGG